MKKRILSLFFAALLLTLPLLMTSCAISESKTTVLYVYNWGEYISDGSEDSYDTNAAFEQWYYKTYGERVTVNYSTYSSNESLYAKLSSGSVNYDVICPSDYMIERMIENNMLAELNFDNIPSIGNIHPDFYGENAKHNYYDPEGKYSVPYLYGMIGIIYNTTMVDEADIGSWDLMWNKNGNGVKDYTGNILQFNNSRDAFGTAQYYMGNVENVNSTSEAEWREALALLKDQKPFLQGYVMDEIFNKMENGSAAIAAYYAGDFLSMYENNPDLDFYYPSEGTNLYVDAMCIPKTSQNKEIAEAYIEFMLTEAPAIANAEYTYYASPNVKVRDNEDYKEYMNSIKDGGYDLMYATDTVPTSSYENLDPQQLVMLNELWEELKSDIEVGLPIYVICAVILVILIGGGTFLSIRKKIRDKY